MDKTKAALIRYVNAATDLAEAVAHNVRHDGIIDNKTILKLNEFITAANAMADLKDMLTDDENESNVKLN